jgi:hypothetical protein
MGTGEERRAVELDSNRSSTYANFAVFLLNVLGRNKEGWPIR